MHGLILPLLQNNIASIQDLLAQHSLDAGVLTHLPDIRWACGFSGSNGCLLVTASDAVLVTDGRYTTQAEQEVSGASISIVAGKLFEALVEEAAFPEAGRVAYQADDISAADRDRLAASAESVDWVGVSDWLAPLVARKSEREVQAIRAAQQITDDVFAFLVDWLRPGLTEREVAAEIVYRHLRGGAERMAFLPIVASGPNGALPHARPSDRALAAGDLVVLDFGCVVEGYASDMTRTLAIGEPSQEVRRVYEIVRAAQEAALRAAKAGIASDELDQAARQVIQDAALGDHFTHSLGHGVGLDVHEWPRVSYLVDYPLPEGAVVTIEPGVYVPGSFGIRIEDMIQLRQDGHENLTGSPKHLIAIDA